MFRRRDFMNNPSPVRVMYVSHTAMLGGGEIALLNLIHTIDRSAICPIVVLASDGPLAQALEPYAQVHILELDERIRQAKKDGLRFSSMLRIADCFRLSKYLAKLRSFIREQEVDIVHANSLKADVIAGMAARWAGTPVIWHVRDRIEPDYLPAFAVRVFRVLARILPTFVVANSAATLKTLQLPDAPVRAPRLRAVVHDGTPVPREIVIRESDGLLQVGLIGRLCPWKGQDIFIRAIAVVSKKCPNARFKIVGSALFGEKEYENTIHKLCTDLGLDDLITFTGFVSDIPALLQELDVVVHASTIGEPFGQVIIEGMAAARPVVATNGGGVPEIVLHNETGLLVPMGDVAAMAEAICQLLEDPRKRAEMGSKGRERVKECFTLQRTLAGIETVYATILRQPRQMLGTTREFSDEVSISPSRR
jgi:glycosyltransferase involved in cell wall biosynthesis